jgi:hypothetical protein
MIPVRFTRWTSSEEGDGQPGVVLLSVGGLVLGSHVPRCYFHVNTLYVLVLDWACADSIASSGARKKVSFMHWLLSCDKVLLCSGACGGCVCTQQVSRVAAHEGIKTFQNPRCFGGWIPHAGKSESGTWGLSGPKGCMLSLSSYPYTQTAEVPDSVTGMHAKGTYLHVILTSHLPGRADCGGRVRIPRAPEPL